MSLRNTTHTIKVELSEFLNHSSIQLVHAGTFLLTGQDWNWIRESIIFLEIELGMSAYKET